MSILVHSFHFTKNFMNSSAKILDKDCLTSSAPLRNSPYSNSLIHKNKLTIVSNKSIMAIREVHEAEPRGAAVKPKCT